MVREENVAISKIELQPKTDDIEYFKNDTHVDEVVMDRREFQFLDQIRQNTLA